MMNLSDCPFILHTNNDGGKYRASVAVERLKYIVEQMREWVVTSVKVAGREKENVKACEEVRSVPQRDEPPEDKCQNSQARQYDCKWCNNS